MDFANPGALSDGGDRLCAPRSLIEMLRLTSTNPEGDEHVKAASYAATMYLERALTATFDASCNSATAMGDARLTEVWKEVANSCPEAAASFVPFTWDTRGTVLGPAALASLESYLLPAGQETTPRDTVLPTYFFTPVGAIVFVPSCTNERVGHFYANPSTSTTIPVMQNDQRSSCCGGWMAQFFLAGEPSSGSSVCFVLMTSQESPKGGGASESCRSESWRSQIWRGLQSQGLDIQGTVAETAGSLGTIHFFKGGQFMTGGGRAVKGGVLGQRFSPV